MSRMSSPTPIYNLRRPEDLQNLNSILISLAIDERFRIKAVQDGYLTKALNTYSVETSFTIPYDGYPMVVAAVKIGTVWFPLPYMNVTGAATLAISDVIRISNISYANGLVTVKVKLDCNSTNYGNSLNYPIRIIVLKDGLESSRKVS